MTSTYYVLVEPVDGKEYANQTKDGLILNVSIEDFKSTQRLAMVVGVPEAMNLDVLVGDIVVVHHNVFRSNYDMRGRLKKSNYLIENSLYYVEPERVYMIMRDGEWKIFGDYAFVEPVKRSTDGYQSNSAMYVEMVGKVSMIDESFGSVHVGDLITFQKESEYEFRINEQKYYRIPTKNIVAVL